ncbi:hypothetical protein MNBD_GAMMA01-1191 [hydrothermal vent metagenome]|uniref:AB hydrolase-1 domain-containing protein n=2 Tax=hydrothermal vent metagenome TaxID=652676 RepID=A0A3B0VWX0_9ZZZZ
MIICNPDIKPKNRHLQSVLASSKIRLLRLHKHNPVTALAQTVILQTKQARLQGFYTKNNSAANLYILLHGWEGSASSTYIQLLSNTLFTQKQASVFRLNFRDHGNTHHLNEGIFHSCRLNEVVEAIQQIIELYPHKNIYLCGFSLGANFSLRVAAKAYSCKIKLTKVFAISPPINPKNSMKAIESNSFYAKYFMYKWQRSLAKKTKVYSQNFDNSQYKAIKSLDKLTKTLIIKHSDYNSTDEYFKAYQITSEVISQIKIPCDVITAWDDPVIPFDDFLILDKKLNIKLVTTKHGGHCGFINSWKMHSWLEQYIMDNS